MTSEYWRDVEYAMGPKRPDPPGFEIMDAIHRAAITTLGQGAKIRVTSGQEGDQPQHGSNRHKTGLAADFQVFRPDGTLVEVGDDDALNFASKAAQFGVRGIGAGNEYMGANTFHFDMVPHADYGPNQGPVWGSWAKDNKQALLKSMGLGPMGPGQQQAPMPGQTMSAQNAAQKPGIMGLIQAGGRAVKEGLQNPDLMNRLALGFNTMRLEPDANLAAGIRESMADRREMAVNTTSKNATVAHLRKIGATDPYALELADAVEAGGLGAKAALTSYYQTKMAGQNTQRSDVYKVPEGTVTVASKKNGETEYRLNGRLITDQNEIENIMSQANLFEVAQAGNIQGAKTEAQMETENLVTARKSYRTAVELEASSVDVISRILNNPQGLIDGTGALVGGIRPDDTRFRALSAEAQDFITNHYQLMGTVFTSVFEALKGGGSITENETTQAKAAAARMNTATTPAVYIEALREYRQRLANAIAARKDEIDGVDPTRTDTELNFDIFPSLQD